MGVGERVGAVGDEKCFTGVLTLARREVCFQLCAKPSTLIYSVRVCAASNSSNSSHEVSRARLPPTLHLHVPESGTR